MKEATTVKFYLSDEEVEVLQKRVKEFEQASKAIPEDLRCEEPYTIEDEIRLIVSEYLKAEVQELQEQKQKDAKKPKKKSKTR